MSGTVVILGMHRTGTSMIGGILQIFNINMGENQLGKQPSNPVGHYEDLDFLSLNQDILTTAGGSWDDPPSYEAILDLNDHYTMKVQNLIKDKNERNPEGYWGWKDPRTSLTIDLYLPYLTNPYIIWCRREPKAISKSLNKRNQFQIPRSLNLITHYNNQIKDFTLRNPDLPLLIIDYEDVINNPDIWITNIVHFLGLEPDQKQIGQANDLILAPAQLQSKKWQAWIIQCITAPGRFIKRISRINRS